MTPAVDTAVTIVLFVVLAPIVTLLAFLGVLSAAGGYSGPETVYSRLSVGCGPVGIPLSQVLIYTAAAVAALLADGATFYYPLIAAAAAIGAYAALFHFSSRFGLKHERTLTDRALSPHRDIPRDET